MSKKCGERCYAATNYICGVVCLDIYFCVWYDFGEKLTQSETAQREKVLFIFLFPRYPSNWLWKGTTATTVIY